MVVVFLVTSMMSTTNTAKIKSVQTSISSIGYTVETIVHILVNTGTEKLLTTELYCFVKDGYEPNPGDSSQPEYP